jgi:WD40 repeat protein
VTPVSLAARVVEVIADLGEYASPRYRFGSGCIARGRTVLTAAHVVLGAQSVHVRGPDKRLIPAKVDPRFIATEPGPDLALIDIGEPGIDLPAMELAIVDRETPDGAPVERCHAIGYPWFAERPSARAVRDTADAYGYIPALSKLSSGLLTLQVTSSPRPLPRDIALGESEWSGLSGAPVVTDGRLLGVVSEHASREGPAALTVTPLSSLEGNPSHPGWGSGVSNTAEWWHRLGVRGVAALTRVPQPRPEPAYWATVREIRRRTPQLLDRSVELADVAAFATGDQGYRWMVGDSWAGKTALVAEAVMAALPPDVDLVTYFLSLREADADSNNFLKNVVPQLAFLLNEAPPAFDPHQFRALWERAVQRATVTGRHLLLLVDGLDEDQRPPGSPSVAALLPTSLGGHAHLLVTSRPHPKIPIDMPVRHPLRHGHSVLLHPSKHAEDIELLARQELSGLIDRGEQLAVTVLGLLTAAAGALSLSDLAALSDDLTGPATARSYLIDQLVTKQAARSLQPVGPPNNLRYQFAHASLLEQAQTTHYLGNKEYRQRIDRWARLWREKGWGAAADGSSSPPPLYLFDAYPARLLSDPEGLAALVGDASWVAAAIRAVGVDSVLATLRTAAYAVPGHEDVAMMLAAVTGQAHNFRLPEAVSEPGYVLRQLCLQVAELGGDRLAAELRARLRSLAAPGLVPLWTTRRVGRALSTELGRHDAGVRAIALLPDGRVVTGGDDGYVRVWDPVGSGAPVKLGDGDGAVLALAALSDGRVVTGHADGRICIRDPANPRCAPTELGRHGDVVNALSVLPDSRVVTAGGIFWPGLWVWGTHARPREPSRLNHERQPIRAIAALPDGRFVTGGDNRRPRLWDPNEPGAKAIKLGHRSGTVRAIAVLPGARAAGGGDDGLVRVWNLASPFSAAVVLGDSGAPVHAIAVLPDGRVVTGDGHGQVLVWDPVRSGVAALQLGDHDGAVRAVAVLQDGRIVTGGDDRRVLVWDLAVSATAEKHGSQDSVVTSLALLPDGRVVTGGNQGRVQVWDPPRAETVPIELGRHGGTISPAVVAVLPDGRVATAGEDGRVRIWDPDHAGTVSLILGHEEDWVRSVLVVMAALRDGRVATGDVYGRIRIWDPQAVGSAPFELGHHDGRALAVTALPGGDVATAGKDGRVLVWADSPSGRVARELKHHDGEVRAMTALPDGRLATGEANGRIRVWPRGPADGDPVDLGRHDGAVHAMTALPGDRLVTSGDDRQVRIWAISRRIELTRIACSGPVIAASFTSTSSNAQLIVAHEGGGMSGWSIDVAS